MIIISSPIITQSTKSNTQVVKNLNQVNMYENFKIKNNRNLMKTKFILKYYMQWHIQLHGKTVFAFQFLFSVLRNLWKLKTL